MDDKAIIKKVMILITWMMILFAPVLLLCWSYDKEMCLAAVNSSRETEVTHARAIRVQRVWIPDTGRDYVYFYKEYHAIVIGVGEYQRVPRLLHPTRDAEEISRTLQMLGFNTQILLNPTAEQLRTLIRKLPDDPVKKTIVSTIESETAMMCM